MVMELMVTSLFLSPGSFLVDDEVLELQHVTPLLLSLSNSQSSQSLYPDRKTKNNKRLCLSQTQ
jgi:hypothetical protein